jgi:hypothetical protein
MKKNDLKEGRIYKYQRFNAYIDVMYYGKDRDGGYGFRKASKETGRYDDGVYQVLCAREVEILITGR